MTAAERAARTAAADELCAAAYAAAKGPEVGHALVAVGGYGRGELARHSDLDVVLVHDEELGGSADVRPDAGPDVRADELASGELAERIWYPLWDSGHKVDHAVRSVSEMVTSAHADARVALGLLDARHVAGDPNLTLRLRSLTLAGWRRDARAQLPRLRALVQQRHELVGELAHAAVPDIKEAAGGLRDAVVLKALVATWLIDVPHADLERSRGAMLDIRDVLHDLAGRATDRIAPDAWADLADRLGLPGALAAQYRVREIGRRITHLSRLAWRRAGEVTERRPVNRPRRPDLTPIAPGVAISSGEVVLDRGVGPGDDPLLLLRAAAEAAQRDVMLSPPTAARLVREGRRLSEPWPDEARDLMVRLLASGRGLLPVWETLEETGALDRILPEWERIRLLPHASVIHRFTVDRHVVETCIEASMLIRYAARPDVLMLAALLHDIGKGGTGSHSVEGVPIAVGVARRMGFDEASVDLIAALVRWHLLLSETAVTRDLDDPATVATVADVVPSVEALRLLRTLTEADARATAAPAWTAWRASLVDQLVDRAARVIARPEQAGDERFGPRVEVPDTLQRDPDAISITLEDGRVGGCVRVIARDRVGLLADIAAA
ncbi:MAG: HD domain-containing protein, partial [Nocardioides sp.]